MEMLLSVLKWSAAAGGLTLLTAALKPLLDRRFSPKWRYYLWLTLAWALLLSPVRWEELIPALPEPVVTVEAPEVYLPVTRPLPSPSGTDKTFSDAVIPEAAPSEDKPSGPAFSAPAPSNPATQPEDSAERTVELSTVLVVLWLAGAGVFLLWHMIGTALLLRRARRWSVPVKAEIRGEYEALCRELGVRRPPELTVSRGPSSPMAAGLLCPRLCLPDREYGGRELDFILRHELTHILRRDLWYKALMLATNALHWFNPLIWLMRREANETVELLCDERAMAGEDRETRREYCETLLANIRRERGAALTTHFYGGARSVKERFKNLLTGKGRRFGWAALAAGIVAVAVAACAVGVRDERSWTADLTLYDPDALLGEGFTVEATGLSSGSPEVSARGGFGFLPEFTVTAEGLSFTIPVFTPRECEGWVGFLWNAVLTHPVSGEDLTEVADPLSYYLRIWMDGEEREAELFEITEDGDGYAYHVRFREPLADAEAESGTLYIVCGTVEWIEGHWQGSEPVRENWSVDLTDDRVYDAVFPGFGADVTWTDGEARVEHLGDCSAAEYFSLNESCVSFSLYDYAPEEIRGFVLPIREYAVYDYLRDSTEDDRRENTPENRAALEKLFVVKLDGTTVPGELVVTGRNGHTDFAYVFDEPLTEPVNGTVHISVGTEEWNGIAEPGDASGDQDGTGEWAFAVKVTDLTAAEPTVEWEGALAHDLHVTAREVSFSLYPSRTPEANLQALRELAVYDPARDGDAEFRRENTPELREALSHRFLVLVNGDPAPGELIVGQGNGHQDYSFHFDTPLSDSALETAEVYAAVGDPLWVADHGLVYQWDNPYDLVDHCQVYAAPGAHIYYHWQTGVMHGGRQDLLVVWADGSREEYLSRLPSLGEYEFSTSYYASDITLSGDGQSFRFTAPDYLVTGVGADAVLENRGMAQYRVDLNTGQMARVPDQDGQGADFPLTGTAIPPREFVDGVFEGFLADKASVLKITRDGGTSETTVNALWAASCGYESMSWQEVDYLTADDDRNLTILEISDPAGTVGLRMDSNENPMALTLNGESRFFTLEKEEFDRLWSFLYTQPGTALTGTELVRSAVDRLRADERAGFTVRVTRGDVTWDYPATASREYMYADSTPEELTSLAWRETDEAPDKDPEALTVTLISADGRCELSLGEAGGSAAVTCDGETRYFALGGDREELWSILFDLAKQEARSWTMDKKLTAPGDLTSEKAAQALAETFAKRVQSLPDWVEWRPSDFAVEGTEVFDEYLGEPQNFCAALSFRLKLENEDADSPARMEWEAGSGLSESDSEGWYSWDRECLVMKNDAGEWELADMGTGGYAVYLPGYSYTASADDYIGNAPLSELLRLMTLTEGQSLAERLPGHVFRRPEEELQTLPDFLSALPDADRQKVQSALTIYVSAVGLAEN